MPNPNGWIRWLIEEAGADLVIQYKFFFFLSHFSDIILFVKVSTRNILEAQHTAEPWASFPFSITAAIDFVLPDCCIKVQ